MPKKTIVSCMLLLCLCLLIAGCWDRRELQERNFVLGVAIDTADAGLKPDLDPEQANKVKGVETFVQPHGTKRYRLSLQLYKFAPGTEEKEESKTYVISNTGESFFEMLRDMLGQTSKSLWFEHVQVIIISEAVLKQAGLTEIVDFFKRDSEMRSRIKIYVTSGTARSFLEYSPPSKEPGGVFLADIIRGYARNNHVAGARADLGYTIRYFDTNSNILLPRIEISDKVLKVGGSAVFKKDQFIGYADEYTTAGLVLMYGVEQSAVIATECPDHPGQQISFEMLRHNTRLMPHVEEGKIYFTLDINMYGNLREIQGENRAQNTLDPQYIRKLEAAFAQEVKHNVLYADHFLKEEMRVDCLGKLAAKMKAYEPIVWEQVKDQWDEIYPSIPIIVSANVNIEQIGSHK